MKIKKIISIVLLIITLINILPRKVKAIDMQEAYIEDLGQCELHLQYWKESDGIWSYIITTMAGYRIDGNIHYAYCMQREKKGVGETKEGYSVNIKEMLNDPLIWRAIINGFPYKTYTELGVANEQDAFVATKQAIYSIMYGWDVESRYRGADERGWQIVNAIKTIVNAAINGTETPNQSNVLEISKVGELKKESDKYYSQEFSVSSSVEMSSYKITGIENFPGGSFISDMNNESKTEFAQGEHFKILVPTKNILDNYEGKIKISGDVKTYPVFYGESYDDEHQDYALTYEAFETVGDEINLEIDGYKSKITIIKKDSETNIPIENVEFNVKYADGTEIGNYKTNKNGIINISNLRQGTIIVTEIKTQEQYILDETKREITIGYEDEATIEIGNDKKKGQIKVVKTDADNNEIKIEGVEFQVINANNEVVENLKTDENGIAITSELPIGEYKLKEIKTDNLYVLNSETITVTVKTNEISYVEVSNEKIKGQIKILKTSEDDNQITGEEAGTPIANVKFKIYDEDGNLVDELITKADGIAISKELEKGKYIIREIETGEFYEINEDDFEIEIKENGEVVDLEISNKSKTPPPEEEETPPVEETPPEEEPPKKLPVTGY